MLPLGRLGLRAERGEPRDDGLSPAERVTPDDPLGDRALAADDRRRPAELGSEVIALFTNADVLEMHATATSSRELFRESGLVLWSAEGPDGTRVGRRLQPR